MTTESNKRDSVKVYGNGREWNRGQILGEGVAASVFLTWRNGSDTKPKQFNYPHMAAKTAEFFSKSASLKKERTVLRDMGPSPHIITCYGNETTLGDKGMMYYNLLLEYGSGGTLLDRIIKHGRGLPEREVKLYALSILKGLHHMEKAKYIHCDIKLENIILVANERGEFRAKIADFGWAMKVNEARAIYKKISSSREACERKGIDEIKMLQYFWRGTYNYMSPEEALYGMQLNCSDIWSFGCIVLEMLAGRSAWKKKTDKQLDPLDQLSAMDTINRIRTEDELPEIPTEISKEAKSFLKLCLVRNPVKRQTASSLLSHSFFKGVEL